MPTGTKPQFGRYDEPAVWEYPWAVFIGRCEPYHNGHHSTLRFALTKAEKVLVLLGSYRRAPDPKNPWSVQEREAMIRACFDQYDNDRLHFDAMRDYVDNEPAWLVEVQEKVAQRAGDRQVCLVGHLKDASSYYLKSFPQWPLLTAEGVDGLDATTIRDWFFENWRDPRIDRAVPAPVRKWLNQYVRTREDRYLYVAEEKLQYEQYREAWAGAPYPPVFVTTDAVVFKSGHVLLVRRKFAPGKGLWALPGGFLKPHLRLTENCIEELKEETRIALDKRLLRDIVAQAPCKTFDFPGRSLRGRTITHSFLLNLGSTGDLPRVRGDDDADHAFWLPIADVYLHEDRFFEDHADQVKFWLGKI